MRQLFYQLDRRYPSNADACGFRIGRGCFVDVRGTQYVKTLIRVGKELDLNNRACALRCFYDFECRLIDQFVIECFQNNTDFWFAVDIIFPKERTTITKQVFVILTKNE